MLKPGYKQTDLGVLPEEWEVKSLKEILKETRLGGNYANNSAASPFPLIKMGNMGRGSIILNKLEYIKTGQQIENKHKLKYGDLIFNTRNTLDLVGKVSIWKDEIPVAYYNSNILQLIFDEKQVSSTFFINYILNTEQSIIQMRGLATGTTSVAAVYTRDLLNFQIPLPPPVEQQAIAEALGAVDTLLTAQRELLAKKRDLKQATQQALLSGERRLPGFAGEWEEKTLSDFVRLSKKRLNPQFTSKSYRCIEMEHVASESGTLLSYTDSKLQASIKSFFDCGDILFGKLRPYLRKYYLANFSGVCSTEFWVIQPLENSISEYVYQLVQSERFIEAANQTTGTKMPRANWTDIKEVSYPLPSIDEQRAIAAILSDMDAELEALATELAKTQALKQGLMQDLLTGTIRLTGGATLATPTPQ